MDVHFLKLGLREEGGQFVKHVMGVANGHVLPLGFNVCWREGGREKRWRQRALYCLEMMDLTLRIWTVVSPC